MLMKAKRNETIDIEQFVQHNVLPVMELLGLDEVKPMVEKDSILVYKNPVAELEVYSDNKFALYVLSNEHLQSLVKAEYGDYIVRTIDYRNHRTFSLVSKDSLNKEYLTSIEDVSDGYHTFGELYEYRKLYNAVFFNELAKKGETPVCKSKRHSDGELCFGGGWFIVMAELPTGQISNHYKLRDWDLFKIPERETGFEYDGHSPSDASSRLKNYLLGKYDK